MQYMITIYSILDSSWEEWFAPLILHPQPDGTTLLSGDLPDQIALHSVLNKIRNLNLELLSVTSIAPSENCDETG
ncbi:MAG: hypothetical protein JW963_12280 [Anaerolineales bacterium]|nr:hypothetical protein [Anaerolineales bacterium]